MPKECGKEETCLRQAAKVTPGNDESIALGRIKAIEIDLFDSRIRISYLPTFSLRNSLTAS
jgi:hypothetical protein